MAPLSHLRYLAVGGVTDENIKEYLDAGVLGFGIGSAIVNKKYIADGNWDAVTDMAKRYTSQLPEVQL